jgi:glutamine cyclotransferase
MAAFSSSSSSTAARQRPRQRQGHNNKEKNDKRRSNTTSTTTTKRERKGDRNSCWIAFSTVVASTVIAVVVLLGLGMPLSFRPLDSQQQQVTATATTTTTTTTPIIVDVRNKNDFYTLLGTYDHDPTSFTQGLIYQESSQQRYLVETTGNYGRSVIRIWDPLGGGGNVIIKESRLPAEYFGEGMTSFVLHDDEVHYIVLTYREGKALIYDSDLTLVDTVDIPPTSTGEAWGITTKPASVASGNVQFYVTDGSHQIHVWEMTYHGEEDEKVTDERSPHKFSLKEIYKIPVTVNFTMKKGGAESSTSATPATTVQTQSIGYINELEYDPSTDTILANVWFQSSIIRIDPTTGVVTTIYDLSQLDPIPPEVKKQDPDIVMNGIALKQTTDGGGGGGGVEWFVTGKHWPHVYHLRII